MASRLISSSVLMNWFWASSAASPIFFSASPICFCADFAALLKSSRLFCSMGIPGSCLCKEPRQRIAGLIRKALTQGKRSRKYRSNTRLPGLRGQGPQFRRYQPCDSGRAIADLCNLCSGRSFLSLLDAPIAGDISNVEKVYEAKSILVEKPSLYCEMPDCDRRVRRTSDRRADRHDIRSRAAVRGASRSDEHAPGRIQ